VQPFRLYNIHLSAQEVLEIHDQMAQIEQIPAWLQIHEKIKIAVRAFFASGHRAKYSDVLGSVGLCDAQNLASPLAQSFKAKSGTILAHKHLFVYG
jgi:hypothetical protein